MTSLSGAPHKTTACPKIRVRYSTNTHRHPRFARMCRFAFGEPTPDCRCHQGGRAEGSSRGEAGGSDGGVGRVMARWRQRVRLQDGLKLDLMRLLRGCVDADGRSPEPVHRTEENAGYLLDRLASYRQRVLASYVAARPLFERWT